MFHARTIVRHEEFESRVQLLRASVERIEQVLEAVEWAVAVNPEWYVQIPNTTLRFLLTDPWPGVPKFRIYFSIIDDDTCELRWIERAEDEFTF